MSGLVGYGSSDEDDDIQPEKPAKVAKLETSVPPPEQSGAITASKEAGPIHVLEDRETSNRPEEHIAATAAAVQGPVPGPSVPPALDVVEQPGTPPISPYTLERQKIRELTMPTVPNFDIPDSPPPPPMNSEEAAVLTARTRKFERFLELKKQGVHFNERLRNNTTLRNPMLLPKLMDFAGISQDESYATTLADGLAVPVKWPQQLYVENLVEENERREQKKLKEKNKTDFVTSSKMEGVDTAGGLSAGPPKKRSRFDQ
ncbi:hypothetical protein MBLNU230_g6105t1 [Neophaeotheca triangularis]